MLAQFTGGLLNGRFAILVPVVKEVWPILMARINRVVADVGLV